MLTEICVWERVVSFSRFNIGQIHHTFYLILTEIYVWERVVSFSRFNMGQIWIERVCNPR